MDDADRVRQLLGRDPQGAFEVVVRGDDGDPIVIRNAPLLDDGTPMPTRYWLVGPAEVRDVGRLEAAGGVDRAEAEVDPAELVAAHERYAAERDGALGPDHTGPRPTGGVGGTRTGVKCLHAHYAWHLAGGDDPVGRWVADQLRRAGAVTIDLDAHPIAVRCGERWIDTLPVGIADLLGGELAIADPPTPEHLANVLGLLGDHLDEIRRAHPEVLAADGVRCTGRLASVVARVEVGSDDLPAELVLDRDAAEDVFRTVVTERRADRAHNPGLPADHVDSVVAAACVMVAVMRRFHLDAVVVEDRR